MITRELINRRGERCGVELQNEEGAWHGTLALQGVKPMGYGPSINAFLTVVGNADCQDEITNEDGDPVATISLDLGTLKEMRDEIDRIIKINEEPRQ